MTIFRRKAVVPHKKPVENRCTVVGWCCCLYDEFWGFQLVDPYVGSLHRLAGMAADS